MNLETDLSSYIACQQGSSQIIMTTSIQNYEIYFTYGCYQLWRGTEKKFVSIQKLSSVCHCHKCIDILIYLTRIMGSAAITENLENVTGALSDFVRFNICGWKNVQSLPHVEFIHGITLVTLTSPCFLKPKGLKPRKKPVVLSTI
jgi:hypothetical protein